MNKLFLFPLIFLCLFVSCKTENKQISIVKNDYKSTSRLSDLELKDFEYKSIEISDREAFTWIMNYYEKLAHSDEAFPDVASKEFKKANDYFDSLKNAKGNVIYYKVSYFKRLETDTIHSGVYMLDNQNKIIFRRGFK